MYDARGPLVMQEESFYCLHSEMCKTLANAKRQQIIDCLRDGELAVSSVVACTGFSQANVSQHLAILRSKGIVNSRRDGTHVYYSIANQKIIQAFDLISEAMAESLASQNQTVDQAVGRAQSQAVDTRAYRAQYPTKEE
jgi:DNA-binding transcriptional ArsR family regulator